MHLADFDNGLARERGAQVRAEVARDRLGARVGRDVGPEADGGIRGGGVARGAALVRALFATHPAS